MTKLNKADAPTRIHYHGSTELEPFVMSPRWMFEFDPERPLDLRARLVMMYLRDLSRRPGWKIYIAHVQRALGLSDARWISIRKELEAQRYYRAVRSRTPEGRWEWQHHVYETPGGKPIPATPKPSPT